jgi:hypothetical protein
MDETFRNCAMQFAMDLARTQTMSAEQVVDAAEKFRAFLVPGSPALAVDEVPPPLPNPSNYDLGKGEQTPRPNDSARAALFRAAYDRDYTTPIGQETVTLGGPFDHAPVVVPSRPGEIETGTLETTSGRETITVGGLEYDEVKTRLISRSS